MPVIPTRFAVSFGEAFSPDANAPKMQERDKETGRLVWIVRALDANEVAARFGAEFKMKITADHQPVPPVKIAGFPFAPVEFENLTITPYANNKGRIAHSFRTTGMRAPGGAKSDRSSAESQKSAA